jgi:hypothetical protein
MGRAAKFAPPDLATTGVLAQAISDFGWSKATAGKAETWYDRFLELCYDNPGSTPPLLTTEADKLWHTHITFTQQYTNYCNSILGFYLDHIPDLPRRPPTPAELAAARAAYAKWGIALARTIRPDMIVQCKP